MRFSFDKALGVHEPALHLQSQRSQLLAENLANADTPDYKARDMDFQLALQQAIGEPGELVTTHRQHMQPDGYAAEEPMFRNPQQASIDGNTVEQHVEMAAFTDNSMRYLASLRFMSGKFNTLKSAIKGQ